jgi:hypothetical protein
MFSLITNEDLVKEHWYNSRPKEKIQTKPAINRKFCLNTNEKWVTTA